MNTPLREAIQREIRRREEKRLASASETSPETPPGPGLHGIQQQGASQPPFQSDSPSAPQQQGFSEKERGAPGTVEAHSEKSGGSTPPEFGRPSLRSGSMRPFKCAIGGSTHTMRPLRYSINVTLDGCCDHRVMIADEDFARKIDGMKKYVVSATLKAVDRNSELCCKSRKRELALQKRSSAIYRKRNRTDSRAAPRKCTTALRLPLWDILSPAYDARHEPAPGRGEE